MMKELWEQFDDRSNSCYLEEIIGEKKLDIWMETYAVLKQALLWEREHNPEFPTEYDEIDCFLDDTLGCYYNVDEWIMEFFDELEVHEAWEEVIVKANEIMDLFEWKEINADEFKIRIARALVGLGKVKEAVEYCEKWYQEDENNTSAVTAWIHSLMEIKDFEKAEKIVDRFLYYETVQITFNKDDSVDLHYESEQSTSDGLGFESVNDMVECNDENYNLFLAAHTLYLILKKEEKAREISDEIEEYEEKFASSKSDFCIIDFVEEWGEDLPF